MKSLFSRSKKIDSTEASHRRAGWHQSQCRHCCCCRRRRRCRQPARLPAAHFGTCSNQLQVAILVQQRLFLVPALPDIEWENINGSIRKLYMEASSGGGTRL